MMKAYRITPENLDTHQAIYERFCKRAKSDYHWTDDPVSFDVLRQAIQHRFYFAYGIEDTALSEPVGLMLYRLEDHRAIEINLIYSELDDRKTVLDRLIRLFIEDIKNLEGWDVVSYAMLGEQAAFIRTISWYGFKPVGQAILKFDMLDSVTLQIMKQQTLSALGAEYVIDTWKAEYAGETAQSIYEAFQESTDTLWDPRFRTLTGTRKVVALLNQGAMGDFVPQCSSIALKNGTPIGFCYLLQTGAITGNIPLVGVRPSEKGKGLGNILLQHTLTQCLQNVLSEKLNIFSIDATMDTDNIAAIKMYRRMGFREEHNYPHVYLTREKANAFRPGVWC